MWEQTGEETREEVAAISHGEECLDTGRGDKGREMSKSTSVQEAGLPQQYIIYLRITTLRSDSSKASELLRPL